MKDYCNRIKKQNEPLHNKKPITWIIVLFLFALGAGVIILIISLHAHDHKKTASVHKQEIKTSTLLPPLPPKPWSYMTLLENESVYVSVVKQYDLPSQPFLMQCGAYETVGQAEYRKAEIALLGYTSQIRETLWHNHIWYRVISGPYSYRRKGGQARAQMQLHNIEGCMVWQWDN